MSLRNKVVLVTGSAGGIGRVTALRFAREGAKLVICDINPQTMKNTADEIKATGAEVLAVEYDARDIASIDRVFEETLKHFGTIDVLVNNTGIAGPTKPITDISVSEWDEALEVNLRSAFYCTSLAARVMKEKRSGRIIFMSSMSGKRSLPNRSPYDASKMGIIGLTRCAADELGPYNITVNSVCPGAVAGPRLEMVFQRQADTRGITIDQVKDEFFKNSFLKHAVPPEDIAEMILFLADEEKSSCITAQDINVNCGVISH